MNRQAETRSVVLMEGRFEALQDQVSLIASDYHNWTDVFEAANTLDYKELYSNYGITAVRGDVFQYAQMFDGPFDAPAAWIAGSPREPQDGFFSQETIDALRRQIPELNYLKRETFDFFGMHSNRLVMFSASWLLPEDTIIVPDQMEGESAIAAIGKILSDPQLEQIEGQLGIANLQVLDPDEPAGPVSLPLMGASGKPVAVLTWKPPAPGTELFRRIQPIMIGVTLAFAFFAYWAARELLDRAAELAEKETQATILARTDPLTQLPNRLALREHLARLSGTELKRFAALCVDIDKFKHINDLVGHAGGETYLSDFAHRLRVLSDENTFVTRHGGSEFFVISSGPGDLEARVAMKSAALTRLCESKITVGGHAFDVSISRGLAFSEPREQDYEEVLMRANRAMSLARTRHSRDVVRYDAEMQAADAFDTSVEKAMRSAIASGIEFTLNYQPIVSGFGSGHAVKFEALARWNSRSLGRIAPVDFIRIAESSGLIVPLGKLLLERACEDLLRNPGMSISINVSPVQLMSPGFTEMLIGEIGRRNLDSRRIEIEVTEGVVILDNKSVARALHELRSRGFSIALDDFGTGFSSVGYLAGMPFDVLKIDRSFVSGMVAGQRPTKMVKSMIGLAHSLDMAVVAEGIETEAEAFIFRSYGCEMLQGYYFGRPRPLNEMSSPAQLEFDFEGSLRPVRAASRDRTLASAGA